MFAIAICNPVHRDGETERHEFFSPENGPVEEDTGKNL